MTVLQNQYRYSKARGTWMAHTAQSCNQTQSQPSLGCRQHNVGGCCVRLYQALLDSYALPPRATYSAKGPAPLLGNTCRVKPMVYDTAHERDRQHQLSSCKVHALTYNKWILNGTSKCIYEQGMVVLIKYSH